MSNDALRARYASVLERVAEAVAAAGRRSEEVRLVAVSKLHPAGDVAEVAAAGQVDFGENYVQEALEKRSLLQAQGLCGDVRWHMIGHVQSRKAGQVAGAFALIHTLDSVKLADAGQCAVIVGLHESECGQIPFFVGKSAHNSRNGPSRIQAPLVAGCGRLYIGFESV